MEILRVREDIMLKLLAEAFRNGQYVGSIETNEVSHAYLWAQERMRFYMNRSENNLFYGIWEVEDGR